MTSYIGQYFFQAHFSWRLEHRFKSTNHILMVSSSHSHHSLNIFIAFSPHPHRIHITFSPHPYRILIIFSSRSYHILITFLSHPHRIHSTPTSHSHHIHIPFSSHPMQVRLWCMHMKCTFSLIVSSLPAALKLVSSSKHKHIPATHLALSTTTVDPNHALNDCFLNCKFGVNSQQRPHIDIAEHRVFEPRV